MLNSTQLHASCVSIDGKGILLLGPSGSGKSDLSLRLIDGGATLVADDRVDVSIFPSPLVGEGGAKRRERGNSPQPQSRIEPPLPNPLPQGERGLYASAPEKIHGLLEIRGVGILTFPAVTFAPLALAIKLVARSKVERLPEKQFFDCLGLQLPLLSLHAFDQSTAAKIIATLVRL